MPTTLSGDEDGTKLSGVSLSLQGSCPLLLEKEKETSVKTVQPNQISYHGHMTDQCKQKL